MNSNEAVSLIGFMQLIQSKRQRLMASSNGLPRFAWVREAYRWLGGGDVRGRWFRALVDLGLTGGLGNGEAHFMQRVGAPAMWSLSGEKQT
jgi:hypothetical protein